jgi:hypothetical protein
MATHLEILPGGELRLTTEPGRGPDTLTIVPSADPEADVEPEAG